MKNFYQTDKGKEYLKQYSKAVLQYDLEGNFIKEFPSLGSVKFVSDSSILDYLAGRKHTAGNSLWALKENTLDINETGKLLYEKFMTEAQHKRLMQKPILQIDKNINLIINEYSSPKEAIKLTKIGHISECLRGTRKSSGGYIWIYKDKYDFK